MLQNPMVMQQMKVMMQDPSVKQRMQKMLSKLGADSGIDPALAGSVVLTTVTDIVGFMAFLGLATLLYANLVV